MTCDWLTGDWLNYDWLDHVVLLFLVAGQGQAASQRHVAVQLEYARAVPSLSIPLAAEADLFILPQFSILLAGEAYHLILLGKTENQIFQFMPSDLGQRL